MDSVGDIGEEGGGTYKGRRSEERHGESRPRPGGQEEYPKRMWSSSTPQRTTLRSPMCHPLVTLSQPRLRDRKRSFLNLFGARLVRWLPPPPRDHQSRNLRLPRKKKSLEMSTAPTPYPHLFAPDPPIHSSFIIRIPFVLWVLQFSVIPPDQLTLFVSRSLITDLEPRRPC